MYSIFFCKLLVSFISFFHFVQIFWSDSGELACIATEESFFILRYLADKVAASQENNEGVTEDGIEDAFEVSKWVNAFCWNIFTVSPKTTRATANSFSVVQV